jgi:hypothetical protein
MASDDLEAQKTALEDRLDSLGSWMIGFIWPVAVGLIMEFYAILGVGLTHDRNTLIDRIGLLLVTAGVSGELLIEHKTHSAERKLRGVNVEIESGDRQIIAELNLQAEHERLQRVKIEERLADVRRRGLVRDFDFNKFQEHLKGVEKKNVELLYKPEDGEAFLLAGAIWRWLGPGHDGDGLGWNVSKPTPLRLEHALRPGTDPLALRAGAESGSLGMVVKSISPPLSFDEPVMKLMWALTAASEMGVRTSVIQTDPRMPDSTIRIVIGQHMDLC